MYGLTRGEKNNNPCNIRISSNKWLGKITPSLDPDFEQFTSAIYGIRAGGLIMLDYYKLHGLQTVAALISRWAPSSDNNPTDAYITNVAAHLGVSPNDQIDVTDAQTLAKILWAIINQENGEVMYSDDDIATAVGMVLNNA